MPANVDPNPDDLNIFILPSPGLNYEIGTLKLSTIYRPTERIIVMDAPQYWVGMASVGFPPTLRWDFHKDGTDSMFALFGNFDGGTPFRHGGNPQDCTITSPRRYLCKANYLFCDGHVETLDYIAGRAKMQNKQQYP